MKSFKIIFFICAVLIQFSAFAEDRPASQKESADDRWLKSKEHQDYVLYIKSLDFVGLQFERFKISSILVASCGMTAVPAGGIGILDSLPIVSAATKGLSGRLDEREIVIKILQSDPTVHLPIAFGLGGGILVDFGEDVVANGVRFLSTGEFKKTGYLKGLKNTYMSTTAMAEKFFTESSVCLKAWFKLKDISDEEYEKNIQRNRAKVVEREAQEIRARWLAAKKQKFLEEENQSASKAATPSPSEPTSGEAK